MTMSSCVVANTIKPAPPIPWHSLRRHRRLATRCRSPGVYAYGIEKQPFITEVYADNETQPTKMIFQRHGGQDADEPVLCTPMTLLRQCSRKTPRVMFACSLFNPYDVPIDMTQLDPGDPEPQQLPDSTDDGAQITLNFPWAPLSHSLRPPASRPAIIQPHQYMLLENTTANGGNVRVTSASVNDATYRPWAVYVHLRRH